MHLDPEYFTISITYDSKYLPHLKYHQKLKEKIQD